MGGEGRGRGRGAPRKGERDEMESETRPEETDSRGEQAPTRTGLTIRAHPLEDALAACRVRSGFVRGLRLALALELARAAPGLALDQETPAPGRSAGLLGLQRASELSVGGGDLVPLLALSERVDVVVVVHANARPLRPHRVDELAIEAWAGRLSHPRVPVPRGIVIVRARLSVVDGGILVNVHDGRRRGEVHRHIFARSLPRVVILARRPGRLRARSAGSSGRSWRTCD